MRAFGSRSVPFLFLLKSNTESRGDRKGTVRERKGNRKGTGADGEGGCGRGRPADGRPGRGEGISSKDAPCPDPIKRAGNRKNAAWKRPDPEPVPIGIVHGKPALAVRLDTRFRPDRRWRPNRKSRRYTLWHRRGGKAALRAAVECSRNAPEVFPRVRRRERIGHTMGTVWEHADLGPTDAGPSKRGRFFVTPYPL